MEPDLNRERQQAHASLDCLPAAQLSAVRTLLETMLDPVAQVLANAPVEDEEISPEEGRAVAEAPEWLNKNGGKGIPHEEAMRRLGLE